MAAKAKSEPAATRHETPSPFSLVTEWARQGTESFFATQRILLDLVMRQNATAMTAVQERLATVRTAPVTALTEMVGEGVSNLIAVDRILLHLAQRENEILVGAMQDRAGNSAPASAVANFVRRSVDTFVEMQMHFLTLAAKQADLWVDAAKSGKPFDGKALPELARESMENFVRAQKKYLDVIAEETANLTNGVTNSHAGQENPTAGTGARGHRSLHRRAEEGARRIRPAGRRESEGRPQRFRSFESVPAGYREGVLPQHRREFRERGEGAVGHDVEAGARS